MPLECRSAAADVTALPDPEARPPVANAEVRYRRLFETARDGILILDARTGRIEDANPFMSELLGYEHDEFVGNPDELEQLLAEFADQCPDVVR